jgi:recombinational DNA repair protein RecT
MSGEYKWITANLHREDDLAWDIWVDEHGQHFLHRPGPGEGRVIETYAAATTKSGGFFITVITEPDMDHIRSSSRARAEDSPWQQWPDQMRLKSAIRRLTKILPMPQELDDLMQEDAEAAFGNAPAAPLQPTTPVTKLGRPKGAQNSLDQFAGEPERDVPETSDIL